MDEISTPKTQSGFRDIPMNEMLLDLLAPMETRGFIVGGEQPITLKHYHICISGLQIDQKS